jgi:hypothetical protein
VLAAVPLVKTLPTAVLALLVKPALAIQLILALAAAA